MKGTLCSAVIALTAVVGCSDGDSSADDCGDVHATAEILVTKLQEIDAHIAALEPPPITIAERKARQEFIDEMRAFMWLTVDNAECFSSAEVAQERAWLGNS